MKLRYKSSKEELVLNYLQILNSIFGLSTNEVKMLALFVKLYIGYKNVDIPIELKWEQVFNNKSRNYVQEEMGFKHRTHVDQYIQHLRRKGLIEHNGNYYTILPLAIPNTDDRTITFELDYTV